MWFRLAKHQHKSLQEAQRTNTSTEFVEWKIYLEEEANDFNPLFYYLAQIAACIERGQVKNPRRIKIQDKLLEFSKPKQVHKPSSSGPKNVEARLQQQKASWFAAVGLRGVKP